MKYTSYNKKKTNSSVNIRVLIILFFFHIHFVHMQQMSRYPPK